MRIAISGAEKKIFRESIRTARVFCASSTCELRCFGGVRGFEHFWSATYGSISAKIVYLDQALILIKRIARVAVSPPSTSRAKQFHRRFS